MTLPLEFTSGSAWLGRWHEDAVLEARALADRVGELAPESCLVGGVVRDLLLGHPSRDLDIVCAKPVKPLALELKSTFSGTLTCFESFLTCTLTLPSGTTLDLATARREHYPHPGALPVVAASDLVHDLYRRDFSVNTFALSLGPPHDLVSVGGAAGDLQSKTLRVLHEQSFLDDPTRIVRGARLAGRLGFSYDAVTMSALQKALASGAHRRVSLARLKNELLLCFGEAAVAPVITRLSEFGALYALFGLEDTPLLSDLDAAKVTQLVPPESYVLALLLALSDEAAATFGASFGFPQRLLGSRIRLLRRAAPQTPANPAEDAVRAVLYPAARSRVAPEYPKIRGSDVLSLGVPAGPEVGVVLRELGRARLSGEVASFADELELAKTLVTNLGKQENT